MTVDELYPYQPDRPWRDVFAAEGLEKLRYVRDRELAQTLLELHENIGRTEQAMDVVKRAHTGMLGPDAAELAHKWFGKTLGQPGMQRVESFIAQLGTVKQYRAGAK